MAVEELPVRVARLEVEVRTLNEWRQILSEDIAETKRLLADLDEKQERRLQALDTKLDHAIDTARRTLPGWVYYGFVAVMGLIGWLGGRVHW